MRSDEPPSDDSTDFSDSPQVTTRANSGIASYTLLAVVALILPHVLMRFAGDYAAAILAIAVSTVWVKFMQSSCLNGGMICALMSMAIVFNAVGFLLGALIRFARSLLS